MMTHAVAIILQGGYPGAGGYPGQAGGYPGQAGGAGGYPGQAGGAGGYPGQAGGYPGQAGGFQGQPGGQGGFGGGYAPPSGTPGVNPEVERMFNAVDTDRSGKISAKELQAALQNGRGAGFSDKCCELMICEWVESLSKSRLTNDGFLFQQRCLITITPARLTSRRLANCSNTLISGWMCSKRTIATDRAK